LLENDFTYPSGDTAWRVFYIKEKIILSANMWKENGYKWKRKV
jgi:hypothetical protein